MLQNKKEMKPKRTLIIGDIHGNLKALEHVLETAAFSFNEDRLICIGDYIDGWEYSFEVIELLINIQSKSPFENIFLLGNHDKWMSDALKNDFDNFKDDEYMTTKHRSWMLNNGLNTYLSYAKKSEEKILDHKELFFDQLKYYFIENNRLFVHAGFDYFLGFEESLKFNPETLLWDRSLFRKALQLWNLEQSGAIVKEHEKKLDRFDKIYIGHTATTKYDLYEPLKLGNVINVDQGSKVFGTLSLWVDETDTFFQSL